MIFYQFSVTLPRDSLRGRANARNVSFRISLRWPIYIINSVYIINSIYIITMIKPNDLLECHSTCKVVTSAYPLLLLSNKIERKKTGSVCLAGSKRGCAVLHVVCTDLDLDRVNTSRDSLSIASSTSLLITSSSMPQFSPSEHKYYITLCVSTWNRLYKNHS